MAYKLKHIVISIFLPLIQLGCIYSQSPAYRQFTDEDGLSSMTIYSMGQDARGYMWIATSKGICRFDGAKFTKYQTKDMKGQDIPFLYFGPNKAPWFYNLAGEIFYINNDKLIKAPIANPAKDVTINSFHIDSQNVYISWSGINNFYSISYPLGSLIHPNVCGNKFDFLGTYKNDILIINWENRSNYFNIFSYFHGNEYYYKHFEQNNLLNHAAEIKLSIQISKDTILILTPYFSGYFNNNLQLISQINLSKCLNENIIFLSAINKEKLFIKTKFNKYYFKTRENKIENIENIKADINSIYQDIHGRYWASTNNQGLWQFTNHNCKIYNDGNSKLLSNEISTLKYFRPFLFVGHSNGKLSVINTLTNKIIQHKLKNGTKIRSIVALDTSTLIVGTDNELYKLLFNTKSLKLNSTFLASLGCKFLQLGKKDEIAILTNLGTYVSSTSEILSRKFTSNIENVKLGIRSSTACYFNSRLYIGTSKGVYLYLDNKFKNLDLLTTNHYINHLYNQNDQKLWISTDGEGVLVYENGRISDSLNLSNGLPSNSATSVLALDDHRVIIGTDNGAYVYDLRNRKGFGFNQLDGLPAREITDFALADNMLWIGTSKGLVSLPVAELKPNPEQPLVELENAVSYSRGGEQPFTSSLPYHGNHLKFTLQTRSLLSKDQLRILYKLQDSDSSWISTTGNILEFVGLAPGDYQLQVKAVNEDGVESAHPLLLPFKIQPPWWNSWWFQSTLLLSMIAGSVSITYWRQNKKRNEEIRRRDILEQMNQLRIQALQNQMNPHFLFNSLNAIQSFLSVNDEENAMNYLSKFGKLIRMIFEQSKKKSITLEEEIEMLQHYIHMEGLRFGTKVAVHFSVSQELKAAAQEIHIPPLLIQPIVENAFRHGLFHRKKGGLLNISIHPNGRHIQCVVEDNGVGRDRSRMINSWKRKSHQSTGIDSTLERLKILDQGRQVMGLDIIDLFDEHGIPCGTRAIINL